MSKHNRTQVSLAALLALSGLANVAFAQSASTPQTIERVEVTGSRIRQIDSETAQPIVKMTQADIQKSGLVTVGDLINSMTSAGSPDFSKGAVLTSNREQGGQYANLRHLGSERVLVLVNGKRWSQTVGGYTDMSTIPSSMVDRVEILKDGASSIYGSDAIAGVINFILKKSMEGGSASAYIGQNQKGDGRVQDFNFSYGGGNEKASLMFAFAYNKVDPVWAKDRDITATTYGPDHVGDGFGASPWGRIRQVSASGGATGFNKILNHTGGGWGDGTGSDSRDPANYHTYAGAQADTFNSTDQMMFQSPTELKTIFVKGAYELTPTVRFASTAMYSDRNSSRQVAGYPVNSQTQSKYPVYIDKDSYFNPYGNAVAGAGNGQDLFFYRRTIEVPRVTGNENQTFHIDGGFEGDLTIAGKPWTWSVGANYSDVKGTTLSTGNLNLLNLKKALGPSFLNANNVVQCGTAANPIPLAECTPFNILGGPSASSATALDYVMSTGQGTYGSTIKSVNADMSGELFNLPAGALGAAVGVEYRTVAGYDRPGQFEQSGYSTDLAAKTTTGNYSVKEVYGELAIPLLKGAPLAELLSLNLSSRFSDYSNFGTTTNSKASFTWKPIKDVLTRGTWAQGFRAPTLSDTFGGGSQSYDSYLDPCDSKLGAAATNATAKANCLAAGVSPTFRQVNQAGNPVTGAAQTPYPFQTGAGNADLKPETAKTTTLGIVVSPSALPGLNVSLDWYRISIDNRITGVSATYELNQCYVQGVSSFCNKFKRDPLTGQINYLERGNANLGKQETEGIDLGLSYRFPAMSWGQINFKSESTYLKSYKIKSTETSDWVDYSDEYPYYKFRSNFTFDWSKGDWGASFGTRYYSSVKTNCWDVDAAIECNNASGNWSGGTGFDRKGSVIYNDLSVSYMTPWKGKLMVGANNVFNVKPRINYDANSGYGGNSSSASVDPDLPIDRFVWVRYNQAF
ncbi:TonB-dependent receptor [Paucibacter sp. KBW04]|uniref:TonB-dependent receptor domain-containing protein n=1 Tax=Paucibacter sp. KBW04 TaxID=2153361 RepID=UPI000F57962A|nr:TonB-dependent receptor [Paucibacter sp. KBW04]RQO60387.1 TonB-dependent receptor [Paucibacter sp. KBW04]